MKQLLRLLVAASFGIKCAQSSGVVSILITRISNSAGEDYSGRCCDATSSAKSSCDPDDQCDTYFSACVSTFTSAENECHFGSTRTPGGNSFENAGLDKHFVMKIPFKKAWMIGYRLDLEAWDEDVDGNDTLIERQSDKNYVTPTAQWIRREHSGSNALIEYKFKVECDANYYGPECAVNCAPRDDYHGHYTCSSKGERICRPSWHGVYCTEPICASGCHSEHGYCEVAGECLCRPGWGGENCDQCVVKKGCVHGTCEKPFECNCLDYWGGEDCSINLNICGDGPCQNGAKCENQYGNFSCTCLPGFSGKHCENADHACAIAPCLNGGKCTGGKDDYECECKNGFYGKNCEIEIDECLNSPCANGARCTNLQGDFECHCTPGWMGKTCQIDIDECKQPASCLNAKGCINTVGDFMCVCQDGWTGKRCDQNVDECDASSRPNPCHNGGICLDTIGSFMCSCREGYEGNLCEREIDECALNDPCQNGGECIDQINGYKCRCPAGFSGRHCEVPMGFCSRSPCLNGGVCFNVDADYECACPDEFDGKNCEKVRDQCTEPNTQCKVLNACQTEISTATRSGNQKRIESSPVCGLHGTCLASTMSDRQCRCAPGFTGQYCHINIDDCAAQPCKNGGTCIDGIDSYRCACLPGWGGSQCQQRLDTCQVSSPCANGAKCRPAHMDDYHCTCRPGWFGKKCNQRKKDGHCASNPCKSGPGVKCIETKRGNGFTCQCPPDRTGSLCQYVKLTICSRRNPCGLHGRCESLSFDGSDAFQCHCKPGWTGERCEIEIDHCSPNPCFNDAECISQDNHYECRCKPGFEGPECRHNIDECRSNPCAIGAKCIDGVDSFECKCPPGRTGHLCEQLIDFPSQRSCSYKGDLFVHSYEWSDYCNACSCSDGEVACTQIDCGAVECAKYDSGGCGPGQRCVSIDTPSSDNCVSASCSERFFCLPDDKAPLIDSQCSVELTQSQQAKINLQFHVEKISQLSQGVHSADVCNALRYLSVLKNYATGQEIKITCCSNAIGTVVVTIHHDNADDVAREIRRTVIDRPGEQSISDLKDRTILGSIYDVDIIRPGGESSRVWIAIAVLMAVLVVLILILGAFIVRYKTRGFSNNNDDSNYTLGSSSGCTDQLVMTSSPSTADHLRSSGSEIEAADQFIWLSGSISRSIVHHPPQKPTPVIFQNQRFSHLLRDSKSTQHLHHHQQHHQQSPPPSYDESSRYYSTIQPSSMFNNNNS